MESAYRYGTRSFLFIAALILFLVALSDQSLLSFRRENDSFKHDEADRELKTSTSAGRRLSEVIVDQEPQSKNLRYMAFGASRTFGVKLEDRKRQAFPNLLGGPDAMNMAIRSTAADYPSLCTYSMIGEDMIADVIILEFYLDAGNHLVRLAQRLRYRFPQATIIVLRLWGPLQLTYKGHPHALRKVLRDYNLSYDDFNLVHKLRQLTDPTDWGFEPYEHQIAHQETAIASVRGLLFELPPPEDGKVLDALEKYLKLFDNDLVHLTAGGHKFVADGISSMLFKRGKHERPQEDILGPMTQDLCLSWYETNTTDIARPSQVGMVQVKPNANKWALQIPSGGWIEAPNTLNVPAQVFVRFLKTTPPPGLYPLTRVTIEVPKQEVANGALRIPENQEGGVILNPTGTSSSSHIHVNKVARVGYIPPGQSLLRFEALEEGKKFPFRVTGLIISPIDEYFLGPSMHPEERGF